jgi:hypothetical protein
MSARSLLAPASLAFLATLAGCATDFDPGSRVTSLRVLAVQADQPFAAPGETVHFESLSFDPEARSISWAWAACVNPPASTVDGCLAKIAEDAQTNGMPTGLVLGQNMTAFDFTIPSDALDSVPAASRPAALVGVVNIACPGDITLGTSSLTSMPFKCTDPASVRELGLDEYIVGLKRVRLRTSDRNQNPTISGITFDGADWPESEVKEVAPCDSNSNVYDDCKANKHDLAATLTPDSVESGTDEFGVAFTENVIVEYYSTEGTFKDPVRIAGDPQTSFVARKAAAGQDLSLWFVTHDDRGGASWQSRRVHVQ